MESLNGLEALIVRQRKEWGEVLTGFETRNKYEVLDSGGNAVYFAAETGGNFFLRSWLKAARPFEIVVAGPDNRTVLQIKSPFRFYFRELEVRDGQGRLLGRIVKRFSIMRRLYRVFDDQGREMFELFGPILHPWTFEIRENEQSVGKITKSWSGMLKEMYTDADNFGIAFPADWPVQTKAVFLGALFLIDFCHFENRSNK